MKINEPSVKLLNENGTLYTPVEAASESFRKDCSFLEDGAPVILADYIDGDPCTAKWPHTNKGNLAILLYGARETGQIPDVPSVLLPDDSVFDIEANLPPEKPYDPWEGEL